MGNEAYRHGGFPDEAGNELLIRLQRGLPVDFALHDTPA